MEDVREPGSGESWAEPYPELPDAADVPSSPPVQTALSRRILADVATRMGPGVRLHLVALLFGRKTVPFVRDEIIPNLEHWHHRSGPHLDFYCIGFSEKSGRFNARNFAAALEQFETETRWRYSGGTDLVLLTARRDSALAGPEFDYTTAVALTLEEIAQTAAFGSPGFFMERLIAFAKDREKSAWAVSDAFGRELGKDGLKGLLLSLVPEAVRAEARKAFSFAVKDVSLKR